MFLVGSGVSVCVCVRVLSHAWLCDPVDCSPPGSSVHGVSWARYWSGLPFPTSSGLTDLGTEPMSLESPAWGVRLFTTGATWEAQGRV